MTGGDPLPDWPPGTVAILTTAGDVAFTAHGRAAVVQDPMDVAESVVAVAIEVDDVQSHVDPRFAIDAGVGWRWVDDKAAVRDAAIHEALRRLAG